MKKEIEQYARIFEEYHLYLVPDSKKEEFNKYIEQMEQDAHDFQPVQNCVIKMIKRKVNVK